MACEEVFASSYLQFSRYSPTDGRVRYGGEPQARLSQVVRSTTDNKSPNKSRDSVIWNNTEILSDTRFDCLQYANADDRKHLSASGEVKVSDERLGLRETNLRSHLQLWNEVGPKEILFDEPGMSFTQMSQRYIMHFTSALLLNLTLFMSLRVDSHYLLLDTSLFPSDLRNDYLGPERPWRPKGLSYVTVDTSDPEASSLHNGPIPTTSLDTLKHAIQRRSGALGTCHEVPQYPSYFGSVDTFKGLAPKEIIQRSIKEKTNTLLDRDTSAFSPPAWLYLCCLGWLCTALLTVVDLCWRRGRCSYWSLKRGECHHGVTSRSSKDVYGPNGGDKGSSGGDDANKNRDNNPRCCHVCTTWYSRQCRRPLRPNNEDTSSSSCCEPVRGCYCCGLWCCIRCATSESRCCVWITSGSVEPEVRAKMQREYRINLAMQSEQPSCLSGCCTRKDPLESDAPLGRKLDEKTQEDDTMETTEPERESLEYVDYYHYDLTYDNHKFNGAGGNKVPASSCFPCLSLYGVQEVPPRLPPSSSSSSSSPSFTASQPPQPTHSDQGPGQSNAPRSPFPPCSLCPSSSPRCSSLFPCLYTTRYIPWRFLDSHQYLGRRTMLRSPYELNPAPYGEQTEHPFHKPGICGHMYSCCSAMISVCICTEYSLCAAFGPCYCQVCRYRGEGQTYSSYGYTCCGRVVGLTTIDCCCSCRGDTSISAVAISPTYNHLLTTKPAILSTYNNNAILTYTTHSTSDPSLFTQSHLPQCRSHETVFSPSAILPLPSSYHTPTHPRMKPLSSPATSQGASVIYYYYPSGRVSLYPPDSPQSDEHEDNLISSSYPSSTKSNKVSLVEVAENLVSEFERNQAAFTQSQTYADTHHPSHTAELTESKGDKEDELNYRKEIGSYVDEKQRTLEATTRYGSKCNGRISSNSNVSDTIAFTHCAVRGWVPITSQFSSPPQTSQDGDLDERKAGSILVMNKHQHSDTGCRGETSTTAGQCIIDMSNDPDVRISQGTPSQLRSPSSLGIRRISRSDHRYSQDSMAAVISYEPIRGKYEESGLETKYDVYDVEPSSSSSSSSEAESEGEQDEKELSSRRQPSQHTLPGSYGNDDVKSDDKVTTTRIHVLGGGMHSDVPLPPSEGSPVDDSIDNKSDDNSLSKSANSNIQPRSGHQTTSITGEVELTEIHRRGTRYAQTTTTDARRNNPSSSRNNAYDTSRSRSRDTSGTRETSNVRGSPETSEPSRDSLRDSEGSLRCSKSRSRSRSGIYTYNDPYARNSLSDSRTLSFR